MPVALVYKPRNRSWTREEVVLAIDLYLNRDGLNSTPERAELSELLRAWPIENHFAKEDPSFRNEQSVRNKLYNLQYLDSEGRQGREKGGAVTAAVWGDFAGDPLRAGAEAETIRVAMQDLDRDGNGQADTELSADETGVVLVTHMRRERNRRLVQRKKQQVLHATGSLACEACGFDSGVQFGIPGVVDCHHLKPVANLIPGEKTKLADLKLVCPNCHRIIHRRRPWLEWDELLALVSPSKPNIE
jgi:5-methylcytosine-specific restriction protein A